MRALHILGTVFAMATGSPRTDNLPLAIGAMVGLTFFLSLGDALIKGESGGVSIWQLFALRSALAGLALGAAAFVFLSLTRPTSLRWVALRSALLVANWVAYYAALPHQPLALAAASYYTLPIFITLFSALFLRERVGPLGWLATALGFAGVLLVLRPGASGVSVATFLPILAAILYALSAIVTRAKCRDDHPVTLALALHAGFVAAGLVGAGVLAWLAPPAADGFMNRAWVPVDASLLGIMAVLAVMILIGSVGTAVAYQNAPPSRVGPFDFAYVGFAVLWGWLFFGALPDTLAACGIALIVCGGLLAVRAN
ncbi:MAG: DMT family transporter [Pseudomonadota bacterium]